MKRYPLTRDSLVPYRSVFAGLGQTPFAQSMRQHERPGVCHKSIHPSSPSELESVKPGTSGTFPWNWLTVVVSGVPVSGTSPGT